MLWIGLAIGLSIGGSIGAVVMGICAAGSRADDDFAVEQWPDHASRP